ncbi:MAG: TatD family hydrolase [Actinobacteria bacterium]|nr:TatD family hydrolase [Actinomycetota bacterium]
MIDSHAHLDSVAAPIPDVIAAARAAGVEQVVTIGCGRASSERSIAIAEAHPEVFAVVGVHPNQAHEYRASDDDWIREFAGHPRVVGIGETGLDYFRDRATPTQQRRAFDAQIAIASDLDLPIVIHTREATDDTFARLAEASPDLRVLLHCFSAPERTDEAVERGYWLSFAGPITYPRNADLRAAAAAAPGDRLLVETDSPYLAPQPLRGRPNEPAFVAHTLRTLADVRGIQVGEADALTTRATRLLFRLPAENG